MRAQPAHAAFDGAVGRVRVDARAGLPALAFDLELGLICVVAEQTELVKSRLEPGVAERVCHSVGGPSGGRRPGLTDANLDSERLDEVHAASLRRSLATPAKRSPDSLGRPLTPADPCAYHSALSQADTVSGTWGLQGD